MGGSCRAFRPLVSGTPIHLFFSGDAASPGDLPGLFRHPRRRRTWTLQCRQCPGAGVHMRPQAGRPPGWREAPGYRLYRACRRSARTGPIMPAYDLSAPWHSTHDVTLFKNFAIRGAQRLQFRAGFFNIFNTAYANTNFGSTDVDLALETVCNQPRGPCAERRRRLRRRGLRSEPAGFRIRRTHSTTSARSTSSAATG